jgi:hypothetical protein
MSDFRVGESVNLSALAVSVYNPESPTRGYDQQWFLILPLVQPYAGI